MISLMGEMSLVLAVIFSLLQSVLPLWGHWRNNPYLLACARPGAFGQFIFILIAYVFLTIAFVTNNFSIAYVGANSHPDLPLMYRLTAVWGAHEGSILLWILIVNSWTIVISMGITSRLKTLTQAILGLISFCFLGFLLLTSNPFLAAIGPTFAHDLNPLLQDPGFVIHPPMLYIGYVGFSVAFAITLAALIRGQLDANWSKLTLHYAVAAWCFLTLGITLGSWWAYRVLGWGGFWFWDPVENASLLPWLAGIALIHVLIVAEKRYIAKAWAAMLALICFALSLLGTFLVRSGVLISAHTFANDPARGVFLLILLAILITAAFAMYVVRIPPLVEIKKSRKSLLSRETALLLNSGMLFVAMLTILLGTLYPLLLDALNLGTISVGAPYFNSIMLPLVLIVLVFMGIAPLCGWEKPVIKTFFVQAVKKFSISVMIAAVLLWSVTGQLEIMTQVSLTLCIWVMISILDSIKLFPAMAMAHAGFAIMVMGVLLSSMLSEERETRMHPGNAVSLGPYQFFFINTEKVTGANYRGIRAVFDVIKNKHLVTQLYPEKRIYTVRDMVMTKVDIHPGIFRDLYIALGEPLNQSDWSVRVYYKPFMRFVWFGGIMMMLGGLLAILQRRRINNGGN